MKVSVTTLVENSLGENRGLLNEHGLSFLIEKGEEKVIVDTGKSDKFILNAKKINKNLSRVKKIVITHNHFDHGNGLKHYIENYGNDFDLIIGPDFFNGKFILEDNNYKFIGSNILKEELKAKGIKLIIADKDIIEIAPSIYTISNFDNSTGFELIDNKHHVALDDSYVKDRFSDEIAIVVETNKGLVMLVGCAHPGIVNMIETVEKRFKKELYGVLGGTHLIEARDDQLTQTLDYFQKKKLPLLGVSHCTGERASKILKNRIKNFRLISTGDSVQFE